MQRDLVERARKGDHDAFAELAGAAISRLDGAAWLMLRDVEQAKDAVQNTLVRAWRDLPTLRDPERFDAWLHRLLVHACIDEARRLRRHRFDVDLTSISVPSIVDDVSTVEDRDRLGARTDPELVAEDAFQHLELPACTRAVARLEERFDLADVGFLVGRVERDEVVPSPRGPEHLAVPQFEPLSG